MLADSRQFARVQAERTARLNERVNTEIRSRILSIVEAGKLSEAAAEQLLKEEGFSSPEITRSLDKRRETQAATQASSPVAAKGQSEIESSVEEGMRADIGRKVILEILRGPEGHLLSDEILINRAIDPTNSDVVAARTVGDLSRETRNPALRLVLQRQIPPDILGAMIENGEISRDDPQLRAAIGAMLGEAEGVASENAEVLALVREATTRSRPAAQRREHGRDRGAASAGFAPTPGRTLREVSDELNQKLERFGESLRRAGVKQEEINLFLNGYRLRIAERDAQEESDTEEDAQAGLERLSEEIDRFQKLFTYWTEEARKGDKEKAFFQEVTQRLIGVAGMYLSAYDTLRIAFIKELEQAKGQANLDEHKWPTIEIARYMASLKRELEERNAAPSDQRAYLLDFYIQAQEVAYNFDLLKLLYEQALVEVSSLLSESAQDLEPEPELEEESSIHDSPTEVLSAMTPDEVSPQADSDTGSEAVNIHDQPTSPLSFDDLETPDPTGDTVAIGSALDPLPTCQVGPPGELPQFLRLPKLANEKSYLMISIKRSWEFLATLRIPAARWPRGVPERSQNPGEFPRDELRAVENYNQALYRIVRLGSPPRDIRGETPLPVEAFAVAVYSIRTSRENLINLGIDLERLPPDVLAILRNPETCDEEQLEAIQAYGKSLSSACDFLRMNLGISADETNAILRRRLAVRQVVDKPRIMEDAVAALAGLWSDVVLAELQEGGRNSGLAVVDFVDPETTVLFARLVAENDWLEIPRLTATRRVREEVRRSVAPHGVYGFLKDNAGAFAIEEVVDPVSGRKTSRLKWGRLPTAEHEYAETKSGWRWVESAPPQPEAS